MKKISDSMKEDSDRIYKYVLLNLLATYLPPEALDNATLVGFRFPVSGIVVLQKITAAIIIIQLMSFIISILSNYLDIRTSSSKVLSDLEIQKKYASKNTHNNKNFYERHFQILDIFRNVVFTGQVTTPILLSFFCIAITFFT